MTCQDQFVWRPIDTSCEQNGRGRKNDDAGPSSRHSMELLQYRVTTRVIANNEVTKRIHGYRQSKGSQATH